MRECRTPFIEATRFTFISAAASSSSAVASTSSQSSTVSRSSTSINRNQLSATPKSVPSTSTQDMPEAKKQKVQSSLVGFISKPISLSRQKKINNLILNMIVSDRQPFSIVDDR